MVSAPGLGPGGQRFESARPDCTALKAAALCPEDVLAMSDEHRGRRRLLAVGVLAVVVAGLAAWWFSPGQQQKHGADVNVQDKDGMTALQWATTNQQSTVVELLKEAGAKK